MRGIRERLHEDVVVGAEGYLFELERRGYLKAGPFVPEVVLDSPEAVRELHREMLRAGAEVMVAFTYYGHREKLRSIGREADLEPLNRHALRLARDVASEGDALVAGNICNTWSYDPDASREQGRAGAGDVSRAGAVGGRRGSRLDHLRDARLLGRGADQPRGDPGVRSAVDRHVRLVGRCDDRWVPVRRGLQAARSPGRRRRRAQLLARSANDAADAGEDQGRGRRATWPRSRFPTGRPPRSRTSRR